MEILLVADSGTSFLGRYLRNLGVALVSAGHSVATLAGTQEDDPAVHVRGVRDDRFERAVRDGSRLRYREALRVALDLGVARVHVVAVGAVEALRDALVEPTPGHLSVSLSTFGVSDVPRSGAHRAAARALSDDPRIGRILVHSIAPEAARRVLRRHDVFPSPLCCLVHDPIYDDPDDFDVTQDAARRALSVPLEATVALFFGTFPRKKGADLLMEAMASLTDVPALWLVFAGCSGVSREVREARTANIRWDDRYLDYRSAAAYFRATDIVVLPYRRDYENDTSGVFVQAALAGRPVLAPAMPPFAEVVEEYGTGMTFACEDVASLSRALRTVARAHPSTDPSAYRRYLSRIEPWNALSAAITEPLR